MHAIPYQPFYTGTSISSSFCQRDIHVFFELVAVAVQVKDLIVHYTITFEVHYHGSRHPCTCDICTLALSLLATQLLPCTPNVHVSAICLSTLLYIFDSPAMNCDCIMSFITAS